VKLAFYSLLPHTKAQHCFLYYTKLILSTTQLHTIYLNATLKFFSVLYLGEPSVLSFSHYPTSELTFSLLHAKLMCSQITFTTFAQNRRLQVDRTLRLFVIWWTETHSAMNLCIFQACHEEGCAVCLAYTYHELRQ
jgi:hypothetical protein